MRSGAQLPGQGRDLRGRIMHYAQLADMPVDFVIEEIRCQIECLRKNPAQRLGDPVKFVPIGLRGGPKRDWRATD